MLNTTGNKHQTTKKKHLKINYILKTAKSIYLFLQKLTIFSKPQKVYIYFYNFFLVSALFEMTPASGVDESYPSDAWIIRSMYRTNRYICQNKKGSVYLVNISIQNIFTLCISPIYKELNITESHFPGFHERNKKK